MREGWEIRKLEDCISFIKNGANIKQSKNAAGYPITRIETLSGGKFNRDKMGYADIFELTRFSGYILNDGDVLMSHINSKAYVGRSVVYDKRDGETIIHGMNLLRIITTPEVKPKYLYLFTLSHRFKKQIASIRKDAVNQSSVAIGDLKKLLVPVPSIAEQEKIVAELDCLTGIIEKKKQQLEELDKLAQSIFYDMFGDPITNEKGWEMKRLGEVGKVITGNTPTTRDAENYASNDYCFVKPGDIGKDAVEIIENTEAHISTKAYLASRKLPIGSVLTTCIGIVGKVGITKKEATCNQQINAILPNEGMSSTYVANAILLIRKVLETMANAPVVPIINKGEFSSVSIPFPPLDLQNEFAKKIEAIDQQKELVKRSIMETETLFNSRMDFWFN